MQHKQGTPVALTSIRGGREVAYRFSNGRRLGVSSCWFRINLDDAKLGIASGYYTQVAYEK